MSSGPGGTADDLRSATPQEGGAIVDPMSAAPVERGPAEPPLAPSRSDDYVVRVATPLRVVALVMAAGLVGFAGWMVMMAWTMFTEGWAGQVPIDPLTIWALLIGVPFLLVVSRRLWRVARSGVDPEPEREVVDAVESRAFVEAVERHDRLRMEAQRLAAEEAGGVVNAERRPEARDPRLDGPSDVADRIAARVKEGGPG
jgi:hypothetical protein